MNAKTLEVTTLGDREIVMARTFAAPIARVFDGFTNPELVRRWLLGPPGWDMPLCEIDLRVGGAYRYVWTHADHDDFGLGGVFREVVRSDRIVHTERFEPDDMGGESLVTTVFSEEAGGTRVTVTVRYASPAARDAVLESGMASGVQASYDRLSELLASTV